SSVCPCNWKSKENCRGAVKCHMEIIVEDDSRAHDQVAPAYRGSSECSGISLALSRRSTQSYNTGRRSSVRNVELIIPPITTVANGRCTSAPALVERAIGMKPNAATAAVISTGRKRVKDPSITADLVSNPRSRS